MRKWAPFAAGVAALVIAVIVGILASPSGQPSHRGVLDTGDMPGFTNTRLHYDNRTDLAICVDAIGEPRANVALLRDHVMSAIPAIKSAPNWDWYFPDGGGEVRVEIGCPEWSKTREFTAVTRPSEFILFLNAVPTSEVPEYAASDPAWTGGSEESCSGDSCFPLTQGLRISADAECNPEWLKAMLVVELGVGQLPRATFRPCA